VKQIKGREHMPKICLTQTEWPQISLFEKKNDLYYACDPKMQNKAVYECVRGQSQ